MYGTEKDATLDVQQQQTDNEEDAGIQKPLDLRQRRTRQKASIVTQVVARKLKRVDATAKMEEGEGETMGFLGNNVPSEKIQEDEVPLPDKRQDKTWYWR
ncbi:hypothetical protein PC121_g14585 [Phytophthora cactorum]|uniref:Uncharacterized protein n=1 Tax=Phytophthora cactorum TaxID=29920 RepID=A0A8T1CWM9_9STRA|nr:hypothetical protein PC117_g13911 [Phytophthora cactorum]KAG3057996.1 hypothetical protein PC121_g14585 [Phytophthora cactorum]